MFNPNPEKAFEDYRKRINREAFFRGLKQRFKLKFDRFVEKFFFTLVSVGVVTYLCLLVYVVSHLIIKFW